MVGLLGLGNLAGGVASGLDEASIQQLRRAQLQQQMREQALENARMRAISQIPAGGIPGIGGPQMPGIGGDGALPGGGGMMGPPKGIGNAPAPFMTPQPGAPTQAAPPAPAAPVAPTAPPAAQPTSFGAPLANDAFGGVMDRVFGKGNWIQTSGFRTAGAEAGLRAAGAPTVAAGATSAHSTGTPNAPGARDIVVKGMTPQQAAAKLSAMGVKFKSVMPESPYTTRDGRQHGAHLHIDPQLGSTAQPFTPQSSNTNAKAQQGAPDQTPPPPGGSQGSPAGQRMDRDSLADAYRQIQEQTSPERLSQTIGAVSDYFRKQNPDANPVVIGAMTEAYFKAAAEAAGTQKQMTAADLLLLRGAQSDEQIDRRGRVQSGEIAQRDTDTAARQDKAIGAAKERQATAISAAQARQDRALAQSDRHFEEAQAGLNSRFAARAAAGLDNTRARAQIAAIRARRQKAKDARDNLKVAGIIPDDKQKEADGYAQDIAKADADLQNLEDSLGSAPKPAAPAGKGDKPDPLGLR